MAIAKHAAARQVTIGGWYDAAQVELHIVDDGCGFDPAACAPRVIWTRLCARRATSIDALFVLNSQSQA